MYSGVLGGKPQSQMTGPSFLEVQWDLEKGNFEPLLVVWLATTYPGRLDVVGVWVTAQFPWHGASREGTKAGWR
jgi:hypothetical protein